MTDWFTDPPPWPVIVALGCVGALLLIALTALIVNLPPKENTMSAFVKDLLERAIKTFIQAFVGALALGTKLDLSTGKSALLAGVSAVLSLVSSLISSRIGSKDTASLVG